MRKATRNPQTRSVTVFSAMVLALMLFAPPTVAEDPDFTVEHRTDYENGPSIEFRSTQRSTVDYSSRPPSSSVAGGSGSGSAAGGGAPAVPAASEAPGGGSVPGGRAAGGPLEMVCTGEREGIPGSAARPGDAGAASSHCQYVPGTAPTTPETPNEEPADEEGGAGEGEPPSTETIVRTALARVPVSGAGLSWQPRNKSYTNAGVPTIVYAATPSQTHTASLFGREVVITLTASQYSYDFGDGTAPLVTSRAGEPWRRGNKEARLTHHYEETTRRGERRTITLTTTWDATTTNPFTGETLTLPAVVTTTEQSTPFPVSHLRIDLTDTADEQDGH